MVQSLNTKSEYVDAATWFRGIPTYGKVLVGDKGFEFYSDNNPNDYVQIPWDEVTVVVADIYFGGKYIPRFKICTKKNGSFIFAARHVKPTLRDNTTTETTDHIRTDLILWHPTQRNFKQK